MHLKVKRIIKKENLTTTDKKNITNFKIILFYKHHHFRLELADMKYVSSKYFKHLSELQQKNNNWILDGTKIYLFKFKTAKYFKLSLIFDLSKIEKMWIKRFGYEDGEYVINTTRNKPFSRNFLSKRIISIFKEYLNKKVGVSMLRHIFATDALKNEKSIHDKQKFAVSMQHSKEMSEQYKKL